MRHLYLFAAAIVIVGVAAYTLTLSFTQTTLLMSQIEALANGEGGESGDGGGTGEETGGENPESGQQEGQYDPDSREVVCEVTVVEKDLNGKVVNRYEKMVHVYLIKGCPPGTAATTCSIQDCTAVSSF